MGGINHYQYAPNHVNWVDLFGLMCKEGERSLKEALDSNVASGCISPTLSNELLKAAQVGQLTPKEIKEHLSSLPQEEGLQSVTILPVEWMVEGLADKAIEPVVKKIDLATNTVQSTVTQAAKKYLEK
ncbi:MAG: hypothetical protein ACI88H_003359 [Cocleimonas sp.]